MGLQDVVRSKHRPFLKWPGNKFNCLTKVTSHFPTAQRLIEPFMGSGAIFLNTTYPAYFLAEINHDLIHLFTFLQREGEAFIHDCAKMFIPQNNDKIRYYELREEFNHTTDAYRRAVLFLYLNRHGYNGLCRYNSKGGYNVPFGLYTKPYFPLEEMRFFQQKSQQVTFVKQDFRETFALAREGDVIYCDPPYSPIQQESNFSTYTQQKFNEAEHLTLVELARATAKRGIAVFISNHDTPTTRCYYADADIFSFRVRRFISRDSSQRILVKELLAVFS